MVRRKRMMRLEQMILRGNTNQSQLAAAFGVDQSTVCHWIREIEADWKKREYDKLDDRRRYRIKQLENIVSMALASYDRSRLDEEEFTISQKTCPICDGTKEMKQDGTTTKCRGCDGVGYVQTEQTKVKGKAGESSFLKVAVDTIKEIGRLEGLYPEKSGITRRSALVESHVGEDGVLRQRIDELYVDAPDDMIVQALSDLDRLEEAAKKAREKKAKTIEAKARRIEKEAADDQTGNEKGSVDESES